MPDLAAPLPEPLPALLAAYRLEASGASAVRSASGLIQVTWLLTLASGRRLVAQRTHPVFDPDGKGERLLGDIEAITAHLEAAGLATPRLVPTPDGALGWRDAAGKL